MLKLTTDEQSKLVSLKSSPGWPVLLKSVMAGLCRAANDEMLKLDPAKPNVTDSQIASAQGQVRAKYAFTAAVEDEVDFQVREYLDAQGHEEATAEEGTQDEDEANALPPRGRLPMELGGPDGG